MLLCFLSFDETEPASFNSLQNWRTPCSGCPGTCKTKKSWIGDEASDPVKVAVGGAGQEAATMSRPSSSPSRSQMDAGRRSCRWNGNRGTVGARALDAVDWADKEAAGVPRPPLSPWLPEHGWRRDQEGVEPRAREEVVAAPPALNQTARGRGRGKWRCNGTARERGSRRRT